MPSLFMDAIVLALILEKETLKTLAFVPLDSGYSVDLYARLLTHAGKLDSMGPPSNALLLPRRQQEQVRRLEREHAMQRREVDTDSAGRFVVPADDAVP